MQIKYELQSVSIITSRKNNTFILEFVGNKKLPTIVESFVENSGIEPVTSCLPETPTFKVSLILLGLLFLSNPKSCIFKHFAT